MNIRNYLKENLLLFDGAFGSYFSAKYGRGAETCELANLHAPELVETIHREYMEAGAKAICTNTFGVNRMVFPEDQCRALIDAGFDIAGRAAGDQAFVFADIGPISVTHEADLYEEYRFLVDCFLAKGAVHFLFETRSDMDALPEIAAYIRKKQPESFISVSFAAMPDGFTRTGKLASGMVKTLRNDPNIDSVGFNCVSSARHMVSLVEQLPESGTYLSVMPNAGYPTVLGNRTVYEGAPDYFAQQMCVLAAQGAKILGGCCGTTPEHIAAVHSALQSGAAKRITIAPKAEKAVPTAAESAFFTALCDPAQKPFAVELDPPEGADISRFLSGAKELSAAGASIITIADCPIARARMDSSLLACKIRRELGMEALPHMTCRDRNLNATKALLLGLCAEDVHNVLVITGDPIPSASRDEVKSVYNFNSRMLASYIRGLGEQALPVPFHIFGALNVNARNFKMQLQLAKEKEENGICGFLTQPVLTAQGLENLKLARETLSGKLLGGIIPIVSHRNAQFMNSEVAGISVDERIIAMYQGADREAGEALAVRISAAVAREVAPYVDGYYLITPFNRTSLIARIMETIRQQDGR